MTIGTFYSQVPADKFYPSRSGAVRLLHRERLVGRLLRGKGSALPTLVIEAQAGQGKTTLIQQFLAGVGAASVWYQVGPEDADPAFFLRAILACLHSRFPQFPSVATAKLLEGEFVFFELPKRLNLLLNDLDACLDQDLYMVFDDLHYLIPHQASLQLLSGLLEEVLPRFHFVFASREPLPQFSSGKFVRNRHLCRVDNQDLALTEDEITDLFHQVFDREIDHETCRRIFHSTAGWVMGVHLLAMQMERQSAAGPLPIRLGQQDLHGYFREEVFSSLPPELHRSLMVLSLLESIPVDLAVELTGSDAIAGELAALARRNHFVHHLDNDNALFGLHHLFQQFLQEQAKEELNPDVIRGICLQAGQFCLQRQSMMQALRYLLLANAWEKVDNLLRDVGMTLLETSQTATLEQLLQQVPVCCRNDYGWICLYLALAQLDSAPGEVLPLLNQALALFATRRNPVGELFSLSHIISTHITTTGHYRVGEKWLQRATELFYQMGDALDPHQTILVARNLAMGYLLFHADIEQSTKFATLGLNLARQEEQPDLEAALLMVKGYIQIFAGHTSLAQMYLEQASPYACRPDVGLFNRLTIRMMLFNFLFHDGDFANYFEQKERFIEAVGNEMASQSIAGPFCQVWEMDIAINQGRLEEALVLAERARLWQPPLSPHLQSLVLQLQGLILAMQGECPRAALEAAEESQRLRELSGGAYFMTLNQLMTGLINAHCGKWDRALQLLDQGIEAARQMPTEYLEACGLLHRASVHLGRDAESQAVEDIANGMRLMRQNSYRHFWGWSSAAMADIFSLAVARAIEPDYVRSLAAERLDCAVLDDGSLVPLLQIETLGCFRIRQAGILLLAVEDLTPAQRELICLLITAPGFKVPTETIQLYFWPESPEETANSALDTLVSRLRKTLNRVLPGKNAQCYLQRERGVLRLNHCRIDACEFLTAVDRGLKHHRLQEDWQAGNAFTAAAALWRGHFAPGIAGEGQIRAMRGDLCRALTNLSLVWSDLLVAAERLPQAVALVEKALRCEPLNDRLHALRYRLCGRTSSLRARQVLQEFKLLLEAEDYPADEISELLNVIVAEPSSADTSLLHVI
ncbi:BTAD domain-containing putative transcriptional regulator [Geothermobacter hydrogeniphilus]|nr:BTAD domain-containing putative transcriptional regulator [Geothermobacter hydrogeniphilus]